MNAYGTMRDLQAKLVVAEKALAKAVELARMEATARGEAVALVHRLSADLEAERAANAATLLDLNCGSGEEKPCRADLSKGRMACARHYSDALEVESAKLRAHVEIATEFTIGDVKVIRDRVSGLWQAVRQNVEWLTLESQWIRYGWRGNPTDLYFASYNAAFEAFAKAPR